MTWKTKKIIRKTLSVLSGKTVDTYVNMKYNKNTRRSANYGSLHYRISKK